MNLGEKLDSILRDLTEIRAWQTRHDVTHETIQRDLTELRNETYGNGKPGLKAMVQSIHDRCEAFVCRRPVATFVTQAGVNIVSGGFLMFLGWLFFIYKLH